MGGSASKNKGKTWEREVAKFLSTTYGESFMRVFGSGAFTGGMNQHRLKTLSQNQIQSNRGDISPPDSWINLNVECKFYADFTFHQLFDNKPILMLETWIDQCMEVAKSEDFTAIFMKFNRKGGFVLWNKGIYNAEQFDQSRSVTYNSINHGDWCFSSWNAFWSTKNIELVKSISTGSIKPGM